MITLAVHACAGTIGISNGTLIVGTESGDGNQLFAPMIAGSDLVLPNLNFDIVTPGCTGVGSITCPLAGFEALVILGGDGDDVIQLSGISGLTFAITALGGPGNDVLVGTPGNVKLFGDPETTLSPACPETVSPAEAAQISCWGADVTLVPNPRSRRCPDRWPPRPSLAHSG